MSEEARAYQEYVTGGEPGFEFLRNGVHFDGIRLTDAGESVLLDAKCASSGVESLYSKVNGLPFAPEKVLKEVRRQQAAADGMPIEWHVSNPTAFQALQDIFREAGVGVNVVLTAWPQ